MMDFSLAKPPAFWLKKTIGDSTLETYGANNKPR
jgi:hypothetical protein